MVAAWRKQLWCTNWASGAAIFCSKTVQKFTPWAIIDINARSIDGCRLRADSLLKWELFSVRVIHTIHFRIDEKFTTQCLRRTSSAIHTVFVSNFEKLQSTLDSASSASSSLVFFVHFFFLLLRLDSQTLQALLRLLELDNHFSSSLVAHWPFQKLHLYALSRFVHNFRGSDYFSLHIIRSLATKTA